MERMIKIYLPIFFVVFIVLVFIMPSVRVYRQTGINSFRFTNSDTAHDFVGLSMKVFVVLLLLIITIYSGFNVYYGLLAPLPFLETEALRISGLILVHVSLAGIIM